MKLIYVAGPYSAPTPEGIAANVKAAAEAGQELMRRGWAVICPHSMTHNWDIGTGLEYSHFIAADLELLRRCDAIYLLPDWTESNGALGEAALADELGLQLFSWTDGFPGVPE
jgi:hypothetical protein